MGVWMYHKDHGEVFQTGKSIDQLKKEGWTMEKPVKIEAPILVEEKAPEPERKPATIPQETVEVMRAPDPKPAKKKWWDKK